MDGTKQDYEIMMLEVNESLKSKRDFVLEKENQARLGLERAQKDKEELRKLEVYKILEYIELKNRSTRPLNQQSLDILLKHCKRKLNGEIDDKFIDWNLIK